ncbi:unnamed protein product [Diatraea saccharalis]|uniref:Uncharacterized protein n=1 Tax=Diatraea saccharalis TaxID=40085 RepID=A0A9N9W9J2_9NEOP|nr:unnamed protein product [Diatraea saccharalis]
MAGEGERASRPNSLLLETLPPEREPLRFDVQLVGAPPEVEQLVNNIKQVAEDFLYHWKTFPIVLPQSCFTGPGNRPSDIIIAPPCDELDAAALDAGLEPHPLSPKQLHSIREKGGWSACYAGLSPASQNAGAYPIKPSDMPLHGRRCTKTTPRPLLARSK